MGIILGKCVLRIFQKLVPHSTLCRGKDMKAEAPTQPYDKIKSNPQNLFDEDFLNRLLSAHFI